MKLTISETITKEVELILPCWRKSESTTVFYITDDFYIDVCIIGDWVRINMDSSVPGFAFDPTSKAITKEEFDDVYDRAIKMIAEKSLSGVKYEFQINEGSIYIDEIVNGKANRQFRLKVASEDVPDYAVIDIIIDRYKIQNEFINERPIMIEEYAMFHQNKWEEVPE